MRGSRALYIPAYETAVRVEYPDTHRYRCVALPSLTFAAAHSHRSQRMLASDAPFSALQHTNSLLERIYRDRRRTWSDWPRVSISTTSTTRFSSTLPWTALPSRNSYQREIRLGAERSPRRIAAPLNTSPVYAFNDRGLTKILDAWSSVEHLANDEHFP